MKRYLPLSLRSRILSARVLSPLAKPAAVVVLATLAIAPPSFLVSLSSSQAQPQPNCKNPQTQLDMNLCAGQRTQTADRQLNQVYKQVRAKYKGLPSENQLVDAQLAWITFRDRECAFASDRYKGGSIAPMVKSNCIERLTSARTKELQNYLKDGAW